MRRAALVQGLAFAACLLWAASVAAPTTFTSMPYIANQRVHPFPTMPLPNYYMLDGATVSIEFGFNPGYDQLLLDYDGAFQISTVFSNENGVLYMSGAAPISEYASAIQSVVFTTSSADGANRLITFTFGQNTTYASSTEHFYRYVYTPAAVAWSQALQDCSQRTFMGMKGYLATITSEREMQQVGGRSLLNSWVGGSPVAPSSANVWAWTSGPEGQENNGAGRVFWNGGSLYNGGAAPNWLTFDQWYRFMPQQATNETFLSVRAPSYENVAYFASADVTDGIKSWICEFGGLDSGAVAATTWSYTSSMLLQFDCELFTTSTDCNNHAVKGCGWSSNTCQSLDCSSYLLQSSCVADWRCDWFVNGEFGVCANTACSQYGNQQSCQADPDCVYNNGACNVARCSDQQSNCACATMNGCSWRQGRCIGTASVGCLGMDVVYLIDGTVNMSQPFERYPNGFFGLTQMLQDSDLALTGTSGSVDPGVSEGMRVGLVVFGSQAGIVSPATIGSGGRLTGLLSEMEGDFNYAQRTYTGSVTTRLVGPALSAAQRMFARASGTGRTRVIVIVSSSGIDDAATLVQQKTSSPATSILNTLQTMDVNIIGVTLRPTEPSTVDSAAASGSLASLTTKTLSTTLTEFSAQVLYGMCGDQTLTAGAFLPTSPSVATLCSTHTNRTACVAVPLCSWDNAGLACTHAGCAEYCTQTSCVADPSCLYTNNMCINKCATRTQATCTDAVCQWNSAGMYCASTACISNPNEDACIADTTAACTYVESSSTGCIVTTCVYPSESNCLADPACMWSPNGGCFSNPCTVTSQTACNANPQCQWASKCTLNPCGLKYQTEMGCQSDRNCQWSTAQSPPVCGLAPCSGLNYYTNAQTNCQANPLCYWQPQSENGFQDMCVVKPCSANPRACDCAAQDGCVWKDNLCRDTTFVQCPAIDVVFLIEATSPMSLSFGRHPNGFSGIVEAIRSWSLTAPLSQDEEDPGFRLAIAGYGSPTRALQPGDVVLGRNFTSSIQQWADVNMILDNFAKNQPTYAQEAPGQVAIGLGLSAAMDLFAMSPPNRQKLLMIMGNSQLTDGLTGNLPAVTQMLEEQGVQIFSNVIRRFSVITAAENVAAEYLKPLATDPVETHYSFSTIDEMQANLLESFCDPSTTIGTALGVSRDGVLPCNWLTGATECGVQSSCYWNATAAPTCPLPGQCANLGCVALPPALAADFECKHCEYSGGVFSCNRQKNYQPVAGVCLKTPCSSNCASTGCSGSCEWNSDVSSCGRAMCQATDVTTCNADLGCVWVDGTGNGCRRSQCGLMRESTLCTSYTTGSGASLAYPCAWNSQYTPALCVEQRCMYMNAASCALFPANCEYAGNQCSDKLCQFTDAESCSSDVNCVWNPFVRLPGQFGTCQPRLASCQLSDFSSWSPCTANCGANAIRYRSRSIVQFPKPGGASCADVAGSTGLTQVTNCSSEASWQTDCNLYCAQYASSVSQCIADASCQWANMQCAPRPQSGCALLTTQTTCSASDMCTWDSVLGYCQDQPQACRYQTQAQCGIIAGCTWRTGANTNLVAASLDLPSILVNPGQTKVRVFPTLTLNGNSLLNGATVTIENGYQIGKDILQYTFPSPITSTWMPSSGTLLLSGQASVSEYGNAISSVTFYTSSMQNGARNITWSLGSNTLYSLSTGHYYRYVKQSNISWDAASLQCGATTHFGLVGYLATITSPAENSLVATKLSGDGWISGTGPVSSSGSWTWSSGPEAGIGFWTGGNTVQGGYAPQGQYANWNNVAGEPASLSTPFHLVHPYLNQSGFWSSVTSSSMKTNGYICEFGGFADSAITANFTISGAVVLGMGGCLPNTQCSYHMSSSLCAADAACSWNGYSCQVGCGARSTVAECGGSTQCAWTVTVLPPVCDADPCQPYGVNDCAARPQCRWNGTNCLMQEGCGQYLSGGSCNSFPTCQWFNNTVCTTRKCSTVPNMAQCQRIPTCTWTTKSGCTTACRYTSPTDCNADSSCLWGTSSAIVAPFYSGGAPVLAFQAGTQGPTAASGWIDGITVRISSGFQAGQDMLTVDTTLNSGMFVVSFLRSTGVLQLTVAVGSQVSPSAAYNFLTTAVQFSTTSSSLATRVLTYAFSSRTVLVGNTFTKILTPKNIHSMQDAAAVCTASTLFGLPGSLATPSSQESNYALSQMNAQGIFGAYNAGNNAWAWTGGNIFWNGVGPKGQPMNNQFSQWPVSEPQSDTSFARMGVAGMWFSTNVTQRTYAVLCQYSGAQIGGPWGGEVLLGPTGCFAQVCAGLTVSQCSLQSGCAWSNSLSSCAVDTWCSSTNDKATCLLQSGCYWSYTRSACTQSPADSCQGLTQAGCAQLAPSCAWNTNMLQKDRSTGACALVGCAANPTMTSCTANTSCRWYLPSGASASTCVPRLCGYTSALECRADMLCAWTVATGTSQYTCQFSDCSTVTGGSTACQAKAGCTYSTTAQVCHATPCAATTASLCLGDITCLYMNGRCFQPACTGTSSTTCQGPYCYFTYAPSSCISAQCISYSDQSSCQPGANSACRWDATGKSCRQATWVELQAPNTTVRTCSREAEPDLTWLYIVLAVIFILLALIVWRLIKAFTQNLNFFAPTKNNRRFRTHQEYASELFEENKVDEGDYYGDRMANEL